MYFDEEIILYNFDSSNFYHNMNHFLDNCGGKKQKKNCVPNPSLRMPFEGDT